MGAEDRGSNPSAPSTSDPTYGSTTFVYDGANRVIGSSHSDGTQATLYFGAAAASNGGPSAQYCAQSSFGVGYPTLLVDEAGRKMETWRDGFGRTIETDEPISTGALTSYTCYGYDLADNVTSIAPSGTAVRFYSYDLLRRLTQANEPEAGAVSYYFTASSGALCSGDPTAVCRRTDARAITTTYSYDAENRLTGQSYSDGVTPAVSLYYDQGSYNGLSISNGKGKATGMADGSGQTAWTYDLAGDVIAERRTIGSVTNTFSYTYNPNRSLSSIQYPSGHTIAYTYSNAGRPVSAIDAGSGINYATAGTYVPTGAVASFLHGASSSFTGISESIGYNTRLEPTTIAASSPNGSAFNITNSFGQATGNNGSIAAVTNNLNGGRSVTYGYDPLQRIASAYTTASSGSGCWGLSLSDDVVGNLLSSSVTRCSGPNFSFSVNSHNEINGYAYDSSGNLTSDGIYSYSFNGENELASAAGVTYSYDGAMMRVKKSNGTLYWRSIAGPALAETDLSGNILNEYVYLANRQIARRTGSGAVYYNFADQLGSTRVVTDNLGHVCYDNDYLPYGDEAGPFTNTCTPNYKFTGYERDAETGLDYSYARYYNHRIGRFMAADPDRSSGNVVQPQTLNKYTYVQNNPSSEVDPDGTCDIVSAGINQNSSSPGAAAQRDFAASIGAIEVFPYGESSSGWTGIVDGLGQVFGQYGDSMNSSALADYQAAMEAAQSPGPINVFLASGSGQSWTTAYNHLPSGVKSRINNVTYISPGELGGTLATGSGQTTVIASSGLLDLAIVNNVPVGTHVIYTDCGLTGHNMNCEFTKNSELLKRLAGNRCPRRSAISAGGGAMFFGIPPYAIWYSVPPNSDDGDTGPGSGWCPWCPPPVLHKRPTQ